MAAMTPMASTLEMRTPTRMPRQHHNTLIRPTTPRTDSPVSSRQPLSPGESPARAGMAGGGAGGNGGAGQMPDFGPSDSVANRLFRLQLQGGKHQMGIDTEKQRVSVLTDRIAHARRRLLILKSQKKSCGGTFAGRDKKRLEAKQVRLRVDVNAVAGWSRLTAGVLV